MNCSGNRQTESTSLCRVCLAGNLRMNCVQNIELQNVFERLTRIKPKVREAWYRGTDTMCFMCYRQLLKCHKFADMAQRSANILKDLFDKGLQATQETLTVLKIEQIPALSVSNAQLMHTIFINHSVSLSVETKVKQEVLVKREQSPEDDVDLDKDILEDNKPTKLEDNFPSGTKEIKDQEKAQSAKEPKPVRSSKRGQSKSESTAEQSNKKRKKVRYGIEDRTCEFCKRIFKRRNDLVVHRRIHTGERPFACDECDKSFTSKSTLKMHQKTHTVERPLTCDRCARTFKTLRVLRHHMLVHSSERPYACDLCDKRFARRMELKFHRRVHTGEKPYTCDICGKTFAQSGTMTSHKRTHSAERPYTCVICNFRFKDKIALTRHAECHGRGPPSQCEVCGRECASRRSAQAHARSHTRAPVPRPACHKCSKTFRDVSHLRRHNKNVRCSARDTLRA